MRTFKRHNVLADTFGLYGVQERKLIILMALHEDSWHGWLSPDRKNASTGAIQIARRVAISSVNNEHITNKVFE